MQLTIVHKLTPAGHTFYVSRTRNYLAYYAKVAPIPTHVRITSSTAEDIGGVSNLVLESVESILVPTLLSGVDEVVVAWRHPEGWTPAEGGRTVGRRLGPARTKILFP